MSMQLAEGFSCGVTLLAGAVQCSRPAGSYWGQLLQFQPADMSPAVAPNRRGGANAPYQIEHV